MPIGLWSGLNYWAFSNHTFSWHCPFMPLIFKFQIGNGVIMERYLKYKISDPNCVWCPSSSGRESWVWPLGWLAGSPGRWAAVGQRSLVRKNRLSFRAKCSNTSNSRTQRAAAVGQCFTIPQGDNTKIRMPLAPKVLNSSNSSSKRRQPLGVFYWQKKKRCDGLGVTAT